MPEGSFTNSGQRARRSNPIFRPEITRVDATRASDPRPAVLLSCTPGTAARALISVLETSGYRVIVVHSEDEALDALETAAVDLILVHLQSLDPSQLDFIKLQRMSDPLEPLLPVLVLADAMNAGLEQACADARVDLRLTSPIEARSLLDHIAGLCAGRLGKPRG